MIDADLLATKVAEKLTPYLLTTLDVVYLEEGRKINCPEDAVELLKTTDKLEQENLYVICLNTKNQVISIERLYKGSVCCAQVRIAEVFRTAIRLNASAIVMAHNHPSGDPRPSPDDISLARTVKQAGDLLGVQVLDSIVLGKGRFCSMKSEGMF